MLLRNCELALPLNVLKTGVQLFFEKTTAPSWIRLTVGAYIVKYLMFIAYIVAVSITESTLPPTPVLISC